MSAIRFDYTDDVQTREVSIADIDWDNSTQARLCLDADVVGEYADLMQAGVEMAPVRLFQDGERYFIVDGFHRIDAANDLGLKKIRAEVRPGTKAEADWEALAANKTHGLRRTNADKRRAVELALQHPRSSGLSARAIAEHCGVSPGLVDQMRKVPTVGTSARVTGADGKSYPARKRPTTPTKKTPVQTYTERENVAVSATCGTPTVAVTAEVAGDADQPGRILGQLSRLARRRRGLEVRIDFRKDCWDVRIIGACGMGDTMLAALEKALVNTQAVR